MHSVYLSLTGFLALMAVATFATTLRKATPYGRHLQGQPVRTLPSRAAWLIFASPEWFAFAATFLWFAREPSVAQWVLFACWQAHYTHRAILYPLRMRGHPGGFPVSGVIFGFVFNCLNGFVNGYAVTAAPHLAAGAAWLADPRFLAGAAIAATGWVINFHCDTILIRLRGDGSTGYKIPHGGMFRYVSAANYFGEIVLWCGWALMTWTLAGAVFALFTIGNLAPRALSHHRWYLANFPDYPKDRKALIPHVL